MYALNPSAPIASFAAPKIERWPSERPLFVLVLLAALAIWGLLALSIIGAIYAALIALALFFSHVVFIAHIRGSGVRLGPEQFPELWERVVTLSRQAGMAQPPEAYLVQAGGSLNAFATKLFRGRMIVLFAELLEACGDDNAARDMVIGHEIGHLKLGHLDWFWLTAPGRFVPFLGHAYSRACEFSCDRWGATLCGDRAGAMRGLAILAAGGKHGAQVNLQAFVAQRQALDTGWMTIGSWLSGYPPLSARIEAIEPTLGKPIPYSTRGPMNASFILAAFIVLPWLATMAAMALWMSTLGALLDPTAIEGSDYAEETAALPQRSAAELEAQARIDLAAIAQVVREHHAATGETIQDSDQLDALWFEYRDEEDSPVDPYDGYAYGMHTTASGLKLFSSGPDAEPETEDDLVVEVDLVASQQAATQ
jgi:Zn-dependent protease with chaperone function